MFEIGAMPKRHVLSSKQRIVFWQKAHAVESSDRSASTIMQLEEKVPCMLMMRKCDALQLFLPLHLDRR